MAGMMIIYPFRLKMDPKIENGNAQKEKTRKGIKSDIIIILRVTYIFVCVCHTHTHTAFLF
jgi:hypothetical protein